MTNHSHEAVMALGDMLTSNIDKATQDQRENGFGKATSRIVLKALDNVSAKYVDISIMIEVQIK